MPVSIHSTHNENIQVVDSAPSTIILRRCGEIRAIGSVLITSLNRHAVLVAR